MLPTNFTGFDGAIVAIYLAVTAAIGAAANRRLRGMDDYLVGGRASGTALNAATYVGTGLGLVTLMYASIDAFSHGFAYVTLGLIGASVGLFIGTTGFVVQRLRRLELLTIPEFFERRFDRSTRVAGGIICALAGILNMGLFPKMGATFIAYVTGMAGAGEDSQWTVSLITSGLIVLVLVYTILGGMLAVIVTDYLQYVMLSFGMGLAVWACLDHPELGWARMVGSLAEHRGEAAFNPVAPGGYGWLWVVFNAVVQLAAAICWAPEASRTLTAADEVVARKTFLWAAPGQFIRLGIPALWGIAAFALVSSQAEIAAHFFPDGLGGTARHAEQAMPLALGYILPSGVLGLVVAGLMAAFMSTHDSYLLCWSSVISRDVVSPLRATPPTPTEEIRTTRIAVLAIGAFLLVWGVWYELPESVWTYMAVTGTIYMSGAAVVLVGGLYWDGASSAGARAALAGGLLAVTGLFPSVWTPLLGVTPSGPVIGLLTFGLCAVLFIVISVLRPDRGEE